MDFRLHNLAVCDFRSTSAGTRLNKAALVGEDGSLHPVSQRQLGEYVGDMGFHGSFASDQFPGDLTIGLPSGSMTT